TLYFGEALPEAKGSIGVIVNTRVPRRKRKYESFSVDAVQMDIEVDGTFAAIPIKSLTLETVTGAIRGEHRQWFRSPASPDYLKAKSGSGGISGSYALVGSAAFETVSGDITLTLLSYEMEGAAELKTRTISGNTNMQFEDAHGG